MSNDFYTATSSPSTGSSLSSSTMRSEFALIEDGFDLLPSMSGNGGLLVAVNSGETALETIANTTVLANIAAQGTSDKDALGGYAGLTQYKINFLNTAGTFTSFFTNSNTAARTYTFQDKDGTIADTADIAAQNIAEHADTTATGAELETLTDGSNADSLHVHATSVLSDTTATGANLNTLTDGSDATALHTHTITVSDLSDTTATAGNLDDLTDGSAADSLHTHASTYLGLTAKAADSDKLDGYDYSAFLRLTGGLMSGPLQMSTNRVSYTNTTSYPYLHFDASSALLHSDSSNYLDFNSNNLDLHFNNMSTDKGIRFYEGSTELANIKANQLGSLTLRSVGSYGVYVYPDNNILQVGGSIRPSVDNTYDLGHSSYRWDDVYATNGTIQTSDERDKNIEDIGDTSWLYSLTPIAYRWKDGTRGLRYGFSAQDTYLKMPNKDADLVMKPEDEEKERWGMNPDQLIAPMLKLIQEQKEIIDSLSTRLAVLEA